MKGILVCHPLSFSFLKWNQVSPGMDCVFGQAVVAINTDEKHCCVVGELNKRATVTPDVESILNSLSDL